MFQLRNLSIRHKLMLVIMLTSGAALLVSGATLLIYDRISFRHVMARDLGVTAEIIGNASAAALEFNEPSSAEQNLKALVAEPHIVFACIYDKKGNLFSRYQRSGSGPALLAPLIEPDGHQFGEKRLSLFRGIHLSGERIGTIHIQTDLGAVKARLHRYVLIVGVVLLFSSLLSYLLSLRLQGIISRPIFQLAKTTTRVTQEKNYSIRAEKESDDELGKLIDGFNRMLGEIQERDAALQQAQNELENRVAERTRELEDSLSLLHTTLESTADGILVVDRDGKAVSYNTKFSEMWRIPPDVLESRDDNRLLSHVLPQLKDPEAFLARVRHLYDHPNEAAFDLVEFKDGRTFERYSQSTASALAGRIWSYRDITTRKQAEAELHVAHQQVIETSRRAGMAEVATAVLHNVGNVLNSVNVSSTLVSDTLKKSKVASLGKVVTLMQEHASNLGAFITVDPKGKQLPDYLNQLAGHLVAEQSQMLTELDLLRKNIEHIKDIIAMQQGFAKVSGVVETIGVAELVEDALKMNSSGLARHDIHVTKEIDDVPAITADKHKVLQILVNLMRNAKHACEESGNPDKRLTIHVANGNARVQITIRDNGIGIPPQNMTRIFAHGFTTKQDGHGFGLHSGALAAKEMGGSLSAHSEGVGTGATFTLELPLRPPMILPGARNV